LSESQIFHYLFFIFIVKWLTSHHILYCGVFMLVRSKRKREETTISKEDECSGKKHKPSETIQHELTVALLRASAVGDLGNMIELIERGALPNEAPVCSDNPDGLFAIHFAAQNGQAAAVELLIQRGAIVNTACNPPIYFAAENNHVEIVELMLRAGAQIKMDVFLDQFFEKIPQRGYTLAIQKVMEAAKAQNSVEYVDFPENDEYGHAELDSVQAAIDKIYVHMVEKIKEAKNRSTLSQKPLLILIGEAHRKPDSIFLQQIILMAAYKLGITKYFHELDYARSIRFCYKKLEKKYEQQYLQHRKATNTHYNALANKLDLRFDEADLGLVLHGGVLSCKDSDIKASLAPYEDVKPHCVESDLEGCSFEELEYRNNVMARRFRSCKSANLLAIVGRVHFNGLLEQEKLTNEFEVIKLDTVRLDEFFVSDHFMRMSKDQLNFHIKVIEDFEAYFSAEFREGDPALRKTLLENMDIRKMVIEKSIERNVEILSIHFRDELETIVKHGLPENLIQMVFDICSSKKLDEKLSPVIPALIFSTITATDDAQASILGDSAKTGLLSADQLARKNACKFS